MIYRLAIEELAYAMGVGGGSETAAAYLRNILGERTPAELDGRLLAAGHGLIARGLLDFDVESRTRTLDPAFAALVACLAQPDFSLVATARNSVNGAGANGAGADSAGANGAGARRDLELHFAGGRFVEHRIERAVVAVLTPPQEAAQAAARMVEFLGIGAPAADEAPSTAPVGTLPAVLLTANALPADAEAGERWRVLLVGAGLPAAVAAELAQDVATATLRASVLRLAPVALPAGPGVDLEQGALLVGGPARAWLIELAAPDAEHARLYRYHPQTARALLDRLAAPAVAERGVVP